MAPAGEAAAARRRAFMTPPSCPCSNATDCLSSKFFLCVIIFMCSIIHVESLIIAPVHMHACQVLSISVKQQLSFVPILCG